jgi:Flp pilus assembly protein TadB
MEIVFKIATWAWLPVLGLGVVLSGLFWWLGKLESEKRDRMRSLRHGLERDPTPAQLAEAQRLWPSAMNLPEKHRVDDWKKRALADEGRLASNFELMKGVVRVFLFVAVVGLALLITSRFAPKEEAAPPSQPPAATGS